MSVGSNLKRRGAIYYARQVVPVDLQRPIGRRELQRSLDTADLRTAKMRKLPVLAEWHRQFEDLRRRRDITDSDFADATWQHYEAELSRDDADRALPDDLQTRPDIRREIRALYLDALRRHLGTGQTALITWAADAYIVRHSLLVEPGTFKYRELCFRLMRAQIEAIERANERDQGNYAGASVDPIVRRPEATAEVARPGESIAELFEQYAKENPNGVAIATLNQARRDIGTFIDLVGAGFPVWKIDKKSVREWKGMLQRYPVKAVEIAIFKGKSFREIIAANDEAKEPKKVITAGTVNRYMAGFGAFCRWLAAHDYISANPFTDMYVKVDKTKKKTKTFTPEQLQVLFSSPLFTGCTNDRDWHKPGDHLIRDHRYWLPHVMMWSGARPGEIAQLLIDDVREVHGHWVMHITEEGGGDKRVKTRGSARVLPIHTKLVSLGFIEHWRTMRDAGETRLFPEAVRNEQGQMAQAFETKFGVYLKKVGLKQGRGLSLYSFRHGFADAMRRAGYMDDEFGFLMGHAKASTTGIYGQIPQGMLEKRSTMIEAATY
jgi:integrase